MQTAISWSQFVTGALIVTVLYYLVIGYRYWWTDIKNLMGGNWTVGETVTRTADPVAEAAPPEQAQEQAPEQAPMQGLFDDLEEIIYDIKTAIQEMAGADIDKDTLLSHLQQRLAGYTGLRKPAIRMAVNHFIQQESRQECGIVFSEEELDTAWEQIPG